jgi:hypothetical protein
MGLIGLIPHPLCAKHGAGERTITVETIIATSAANPSNQIRRFMRGRLAPFRSLVKVATAEA